jgi:LysM repeat protein
MSASKARGSGGRKQPKASDPSEIVDLYKGFPQEERKEARGLLNQATLSVWAATFILCGILVFGLHQIRGRLERILAAVERSAQEDKLVLEGMDELLARADRPLPEATVESPSPPPAGREQGLRGEEKRAGSDSLARRYKIYYRVKEGDGLGKVAERFRVAEDQLRLWNGLKETDAVLPGQVLVIHKVAQPDKVVAVAGSPTPTRQAKREEPPSPQPRPAGAASEPPPHTHASPEEEAAVAADLEPPGTIFAGQRLRIPTGSEDEEGMAAAAEPILHAVREGENLYRIGRAYGVDWERIARANGIADPAALYAGQVLKIPARNEGPGP